MLGGGEGGEAVGGVSGREREETADGLVERGIEEEGVAVGLEVREGERGNEEDVAHELGLEGWGQHRRRRDVVITLPGREERSFVDGVRERDEAGERGEQRVEELIELRVARELEGAWRERGVWGVREPRRGLGGQRDGVSGDAIAQEEDGGVL